MGDDKIQPPPLRQAVAFGLLKSKVMRTGFDTSGNAGQAMNPTICVVEDNPDNRMLLQAILSGSYEVVEYEDGESALDGIRAQRPDLLLLDVSLPGIDGPEVVRRLRADDTLRDLPVIALTAHTMTGDRERLLAAGFDDYLKKPITNLSTVSSMIEQWIGGRR